MWKRKDLKKRGKAAFFKNFWAAVAVCFILAFTGAEFADSVSFIHDFSTDEMAPDGEVVTQVSNVSNWDLMMQWLHVDTTDGTHPAWATASVLKPYFDIFTSPVSPFFALISRSDMASGVSITLAILGTLISLWFTVWVISALLVGARRFFLENRTHDHISIAAMFTPFQRGNWWNVTKAMLLQTVYMVLWMLTLVGGFIKTYSYRMVPYILAENPQAKPREVIRLSRRMMKGNKWRCFLIDLTFILQWTVIPSFIAYTAAFCIGLATGKILLVTSIVGLLTGLLSLFFVNAYKAATYAELYIALRRETLQSEEPLRVLFTVPAFDPVEQTPAAGAAVPQAPALADETVFHLKHHHKFDYNRHYTIKSIILLFFAFSFVGWAWEVGLHIATQGILVNRGTMLGPWLPIYGAGGALVLVLLKKLFKHPVATFFVSMVLCSIIEYVTSWYLEFSKGIRWWDYSGYFMNLNGRICLEGAVVFGLGCCAVVYFAGPALGALIDRLSSPVQLVLCAVLVALFASDAAYSHLHPNTGKGITDYDDSTAAETQQLIVAIAPIPAAPTSISRLL